METKTERRKITLFHGEIGCDYVGAWRLYEDELHDALSKVGHKRHSFHILRGWPQTTDTVEMSEITICGGNPRFHERQAKETRAIPLFRPDVEGCSRLSD